MTEFDPGLSDGPTAAVQLILDACRSAASLDHGDFEPIPGGYRVIDANGLALAHVYGQPTAAIALSDQRLTDDEAEKIARLIARLPELVELERDRNKAKSRRTPQPLRSKPVTIGDLARDGKLLEVECTSDLEEFAIPCEVADRHWLAPERLGRATALGLVPIPLQLDQLGQPDDQPGDFLRLIIGQPLVREGDSGRRLPVHMGQRQAIGIDHTIAARDRLESPWSREAALRHAARISCAAAGGPSGGQEDLSNFLRAYRIWNPLDRSALKIASQRAVSSEPGVDKR